MPKILIVGHGRHGKDEACETLARATGWKNAGTTSLYLAPVVYQHLREIGYAGSPEEAYAQRHQHRDLWRRLGDEYRKDDPARLVKDAFAAGDITGGCRGLPEIQAVRREGLADLIVWVWRPSEPKDPTLEFGPEHADLIVANVGTLEEFRLKIQRLGKLLGGYA